VRGMVARQHQPEEAFVAVNGNGNPPY
jgi:hypothetical protein